MAKLFKTQPIAGSKIVFRGEGSTKKAGIAVSTDLILVDNDPHRSNYT